MRHWRIQLALLAALAVALSGCAAQKPVAPRVPTEAAPPPPETGAPESSTETLPPGETLYRKPVIYLYPQRTMPVRVEVSVAGRFTETIPPIDSGGGWSVIAHPSGRITDSSGKAYPYLFWEAQGSPPADLSRGFVVTSAQTRSFLMRKLSLLGLSASEASEFIAYWAPLMERSRYNLVRFEGPAYERAARLSIEPEPDRIIRVFMVVAPLERPVAVEPQHLVRPGPRAGFTVVEWGGAMLPAR